MLPKHSLWFFIKTEMSWAPENCNNSFLGPRIWVQTYLMDTEIRLKYLKSALQLIADEKQFDSPYVYPIPERG